MKPWTRDRNCFSTRFPVDPARREDFLRTFEDMCDVAEPYYRRGCKFAFQGWARDPNEFVVFASWSEDVVRELRANPDYKTLTAGLLDCCNGPMVMEQYSGLETDRSVFDAYPAGSSVVHQAGNAHEVVFK